MKNLKEIYEKIKSVKNILILTHQRPDGDALGSMLGLRKVIEQLNIPVDTVVTNIPKFAKLFPDYETLIFDTDKVYDLIILVDVSFGGQLGELGYLSEEVEKLIVIDHHNVTLDSNILHSVDSNASSATMMIYRLLKENKVEIDKDIATCLYAGLLTDTGGFQYQNTTSEALLMAADLINMDINHNELYNNLIRPEYTMDYLLLQSDTIHNLEIIDEKIAFCFLDYDSLQKYPYEEAKNFVNVGRNIEGVEVSIFVQEEEKGKYRASLRSKRYLDVSLICNKFDGGGHSRASGFRFVGDFEKTKKELLNEIKKDL